MRATSSVTSQYQTKFPALYQWIGKYTSSKTPSSANQYLVVLFYDEEHGIVMQKGVSSDRYVGEMCNFIPCTDNQWELCPPTFEVRITN